MAAPVVYIILCFFILLFFTALLFFSQLAAWEMPSLKVIYNTLGRDVRAGIRYLRTQAYIHNCHYRDLSVGNIFQKIAEKRPDHVCFIYEDKRWTFREVNDYSNQIANSFLAAGYEKGDEVALFMENCPEYACIWLGLSKIGVVTALINTNLRMQTLAHSINVVNTKSIIFNGGLAHAVKEVLPLLERKGTIECYSLGKIEPNNNNFLVKSLESCLQDVSKSAPKPKQKVGFKDKLLYVYTSGTTGMPKAAIIRHSRYIWIASAAKFVLLLKDDDVFYNPLPMYHTAGGFMFLSVVLSFGGTMVIRRKFSASNFWSECVKYKATVSQYIGEICRYLLNQPEKSEDSQHNIRLMCGNGLRAHLWKEFQNRFNIKEIIELYGSTEGNANVVNMFGKVGSVGFISRVFSRLHPVTLIKVDPETGEPIRNKAGLCIRCQPGEPGEIVGKIVRNNPINDFDGYANEAATKKKIVKNCFQRGDMAFLSGDILVMDEDGYLYFMDRTGDTFRWRGENVATSEVENVVDKILGSVTCVVYGAEIPGAEGKAGMAAIQSSSPIDMETLYKSLIAALPTYAVPIFVRICAAIEFTGTYKLKKVELQKEGYNLDRITDPLYFLDAKKKSYVRLDKETYQSIIDGKIRL